MLPIRQTIVRFEQILGDLDALAATLGGETAEAIEDLNAELEDALLLLGELNPAEENGREEFTDTMEDLRALAGDYRALGAGDPGLMALADRLDETAAAARRACTE